MWNGASLTYYLDSSPTFRSFLRKDNTVRKGSYERLINQYYGKNILFKRTLPYAGNYQLLELNEKTKDVELSLSNLLKDPGTDNEGYTEDLVESYNKLIESFDSLENKEFATKKNWLTSLADTYSAELQKAGFLISEDGSLIRKNEEQSLEIEAAFQNLFHKQNSFGKHLLDRTLQISKEALSSLGHSPKLYSASGSFIYSVDTGTLFNDCC